MINEGREDTAKIMNAINIAYRNIRTQSLLWTKKSDRNLVYRVFSVTIGATGQEVVNYAPDIPSIVDALYSRYLSDFLLYFEPHKD